MVILENLEIFISLGAAILGLFISTLTFLSKFIKNAKAKKTAQNIIKITQDIIPFIKEAEKFIHYTGSEKKNYVLIKALRLVIDNKMKVNENTISDTIDELVRLTKEVNIRNNYINKNGYDSSKELQSLHT